MSLLVLGISHHSAAVEVRERVAFAPEQVSEALTDACERVQLDEAVILSTCNRTEIYAIVPEAVNRAEKAHALVEWMADYHHLSADQLHSCAYHHDAEKAVHHLVQVASGLDSMVLGEPQIFGQLKSAFAVARDAGATSAEMGRLFPRVFSLAKRVRTDTAIGENPVSVAYAAVDLAGHIFSDLGQCNALLVGAGETIELVTRHLIEAGVTNIVIANRTLGRARELAQQFSAEAVLLADIPEQLLTADIVISSTASQLPLLGKGAVEEALKKRRHRPYLMVDLAVPRDIESQVSELRDVYLYTVDDLREIVDENMRSRRDEASKADLIIEAGVQEYLQEVRSLGALDAVKEYRSMADQLREGELRRAQRSLARGDDPQQVIAQLARTLTNKLIHAPTAGLKKASADGRQDLVNNACQLLGVERSKGGASGKTNTQESEASLPDAPLDSSPDTSPEKPTRTLQ
ncbi:MAG: glutamyl-tRNA reductase [Halioglobus sp.]